MSELVGEARVRVRADTRGFESQLRSDLRAPLASIAKAIGGALIIKEGFSFGKEVLQDAARVQKSTEVIRDEFGKAGDSIIEFADTAGLKLGIASHVTEDTAARFGVLFKNIGVGKTQAAAMTLNLEKLAGSIAAIRGKDPAAILGTLPLALSGSLRGLRQLGFAFTPVQVKQEALALGLIKTTKQAIDPGARAIAIYGLVTKNLGDYQDQAAQHASDAYNIQKRLSAEWDHAKEVIGTGLLPEISKYGGELSDWIDKAEKSGELQRDINAITHDGAAVIKDFAGAIKTAHEIYGLFADLVGGDHNAIKILANAFILLNLKAKAVEWGLIQSNIEGVGKKAVVSEAEVAGLSGAMGRLKKLSPLALVIALSVIPPNKKGQDILDKYHLGFLGKLPFGVGAAEQQLTAAGNKVGEAFSKGVADVLGKPKSSKGTSPTQAVLEQTFAQAKLLNPNLTPAIFKLEQQIAKAGPGVKSKGSDLGAEIGKGIVEGLAKKEIAKATATTALTALKSAAAVANNEAAQQLTDAQYQVSQARDTLAQAVKESKRAVADSINQAKQNLDSIAASIAGSAGKTDGKASITGILAVRLKELQARVKTGVADTKTVRLAQELQNQIAFKANQPGAGGGLERRLADLADLFNRGSIGKGAADKGLDRILKSAGINASVIQRGQGVAAADQFRAEVAAFKAQVAATAAGPQGKGSGFAVAIVKPLEVLHDQQRIIAQDAHAVGQAQLGVQRAGLHVQQTAAAEAKKQTALLAKIAANQPSKHETAQLDALLRKQGVSKTAKDAETATRGRHGG